jgi:hypothetical protein
VPRKKRRSLARAFHLLAALPADFEISGREKDKPQKRKGLRGTLAMRPLKTANE